MLRTQVNLKHQSLRWEQTPLCKRSSPGAPVWTYRTHGVTLRRFDQPSSVCVMKCVGVFWEKLQFVATRVLIREPGSRRWPGNTEPNSAETTATPAAGGHLTQNKLDNRKWLDRFIMKSYFNKYRTRIQRAEEIKDRLLVHVSLLNYTSCQSDITVSCEKLPWKKYDVIVHHLQTHQTLLWWDSSISSWESTHQQTAVIRTKTCFCF